MSRQLKAPVGLILATALGVFSLMIACTYLVRTRPVLESHIAPKLRSLAIDHDIALRVESIRPAGFFGLQLDDVEAHFRRKGMAVHVDARAIEVRPSLASLFRGKLKVGHLKIRNGDLTVSPDRSTPTAEASLEQPSSPKPAATAPPAAPSKPPPEPARRLVKVELENVELHAALGRITTNARPVRLEHAELHVAEERGDFSIPDANGFGYFPGRIPFALSSRPTPGDTGGHPGATEFLVEPASPWRLSDWLGVIAPADVRFGRLRACPSCSRARACVEDIEVDAGPVRLPSAGVCAEFKGGGLKLTTNEIELVRDGDTFPVRVTGVTASAFQSAAPWQFEATLDGNELGRAAIDGRFHRRSGSLQIGVETSRFRVGRIWRLLGVSNTIRGGVVDGSLDIRLFLRSSLAHVVGDIGYRDAIVEHDFLDTDPLSMEASRLHVEGLTDLGLRHVSLTGTRVALGSLEPIHIDGYVSRADPGLAFELDLSARNVNAPTLRDTLPSSLALPAEGAKIEGDFDVSVYSAGHTAYPDSLQLDINVGGDVDVVRESPYTDVPSLALNGPPLPTPTSHPIADIPLSKWVSLHAIPERIPRILLAAEDAHFYEHPGFDWKGIRNAMAHNLKVDRLERGGSTITQQLAKNLFLTQKRTLARKLQEVWVTWRLESRLEKDRILELYVNLVEWGPGVRGLHEAASHYFRTTPDELTVPQMALLSAILPGPNLYGPLIDRGYLPSSRVEKVEHILDNLQFLDVISKKSYEEIYGEAKKGEIGGLDLTVCRDDKHAPPRAPNCPTSS